MSKVFVLAAVVSIHLAFSQSANAQVNLSAVAPVTGASYNSGDKVDIGVIISFNQGDSPPTLITWAIRKRNAQG